MKKKFNLSVTDVITVISAAVLLYIEFVRPEFSKDEIVNGILTVIISRFAGFAVFLSLAVRLKYKVWKITDREPQRAFLSCVPAFAVVINNFPFVGLISGNITLTRGLPVILLFALESLMIGLFEEFAFRAVLYPAILEKHRNSKKEIFWSSVISSALFGGIHLLNIIDGASIGSVLLQVGYSFLIGGMCAIVLLKMHSIWICVLLHAIFDFGGFLVGTVAEGIIWDAVTVTVTAVLGVLTLIHMLIVLSKITPDQTDWIFTNTTVRNICNQDIDRVMDIYAFARKQMANDGNPHQWGDKQHPKTEVIENDVRNKVGYVVVKDGSVRGVFAFMQGPDPTYTLIENGQWLNDEPYGVIHRIASDGSVRGVFDVALAFASTRCKELRIDTHEDNKRMQHVLDKHGFERCGIIYIDDGSPRIAYQKHITK